MAVDLHRFGRPCCVGASPEQFPFQFAPTARIQDGGRSLPRAFAGGGVLPVSKNRCFDSKSQRSQRTSVTTTADALHWGGMTRGKSLPSARPNEAPDETAADRLQAAVDELAQNVRVLTDIVGELREDLSWLTRNGVPHQPVTVLVHRMPHVAAKGSNDSKESSGGSLELSFARWPVRDPTVDTLADDQVRAAVIDDIVQRLAEPLGELAQEQLNVLVSVIDNSHRELLKAIRQPQATSPADEPATSESSPTKPRRRRTKQPPSEPVTPTNPVSTVASVAPITVVEPTASTEPPPPHGKLF